MAPYSAFHARIQRERTEYKTSNVELEVAIIALAGLGLPAKGTSHSEASNLVADPPVQGVVELHALVAAVEGNDPFSNDSCLSAGGPLIQLAQARHNHQTCMAFPQIHSVPFQVTSVAKRRVIAGLVSKERIVALANMVGQKWAATAGGH